MRLITTADQELLWEFLYEALFVPEGASPFPIDFVKQPQIAKYVDDWGRPGDLGLIAEDDSGGNSIGAVCVRLFDQSQLGYGFVAEDIPELTMAVRETHRGQGVGSKLLQSLIELVSKQYRGISLSVDQNNPAKRLYERFKFQEIPQKTSNNLIMVRLFE